MNNKDSERANKISVRLSPLEFCFSSKIIVDYYFPKIIWQRQFYVEYSTKEHLTYG